MPDDLDAIDSNGFRLATPTVRIAIAVIPAEIMSWRWGKDVFRLFFIYFFLYFARLCFGFFFRAVRFAARTFCSENRRRPAAVVAVRNAEPNRRRTTRRPTGFWRHLSQRRRQCASGISSERLVRSVHLDRRPSVPSSFRPPTTVVRTIRLDNSRELLLL